MALSLCRHPPFISTAKKPLSKHLEGCIWQPNRRTYPSLLAGTSLPVVRELDVIVAVRVRPSNVHSDKN
jgi:hypothetical protein